MAESSPNSIQYSQRSKAQTMTGLFALKTYLSRLVTTAVDLIFPPRCAGCGQIDTEWCSKCQSELNALPTAHEIAVREPLSGVAAATWHTGIIREAVQALKYENARQVARPLGSRMAECLQQQPWKIDMIVPVPLHTKRLRERGYNQAKLLAEQVGVMTSIPCSPEALQRTRETQSQVTVSGIERLTNISGAFEALPSIVNDKVVLIVDDVYTTGSTLSACAEALLNAGAKQVYGLTVTAAGHPFTHK